MTTSRAARFGDAFLAVDWGTTNRRVYRIEGGQVVATDRDARGVTAVPADGFPAEVADLRARFGDLPMLLAGMVGSTIGWRDVPYVGVPAGIDTIAPRLGWIDDRTAIVPGLSFRDGARADVMRGEEIQLLGAIAAGLVPRDGLLCQPGTHCKWARVAGGVVVDFTTAMTGELFALLRGTACCRRSSAALSRPARRSATASRRASGATCPPPCSASARASCSASATIPTPPPMQAVC